MFEQGLKSEVRLEYEQFSRREMQIGCFSLKRSALLKRQFDAESGGSIMRHALLEKMRPHWEKLTQPLAR
jgi:hypothetical protein